MANQGMGYSDILSFYYPGTSLKKLTLEDTTGSGLSSGGELPYEPIGQVRAIADAPVYQSASTGAAVLGTVPAGETVDVYGVETGWAFIGWGTLRGFAETSLFVIDAEPTAVPTPSAPGEGRMAVITMASETGRLYLRSGPSTETAAVTTVGHGDVVLAGAESGEWTAVTTADGKSGYIKTKYLVYQTPGATETPTH